MTQNISTKTRSVLIQLRVKTGSHPWHMLHRHGEAGPDGSAGPVNSPYWSDCWLPLRFYNLFKTLKTLITDSSTSSRTESSIFKTFFCAKTIFATMEMNTKLFWPKITAEFLCLQCLMFRIELTGKSRYCQYLLPRKGYRVAICSRNPFKIGRCVL